MNKNLIFIILAISLFSLIVIFPRFYETTEENNIDWRIVNDAKNLCIALCEYIISNFTIENVCLSDRDTITGAYWIYKNISCFVNGIDNPCVEKGDIEIVLYNNCTLKDIKYSLRK